MGSFGRRIELWRTLEGASEGRTLRELARRFGVSKNTVQRDLDALSRAGIAVREEREGTALRFRIEGEERSEVAALRAAEAVLERMGETRLAAEVRAVRGPRSSRA
ncbi:MAG: HTH domain-containing protein [Myxococcales bacterium]|jgi:predicted DNA-binding transcriptional regulator YafY